jgi:hypothetical protein
VREREENGRRIKTCEKKSQEDKNC